MHYRPQSLRLWWTCWMSSNNQNYAQFIQQCEWEISSAQSGSGFVFVQMGNCMVDLCVSVLVRSTLSKRFLCKTIKPQHTRVLSEIETNGFTMCICYKHTHNYTCICMVAHNKRLMDLCRCTNDIELKQTNKLTWYFRRSIEIKKSITRKHS